MTSAIVNLHTDVEFSRNSNIKSSSLLGPNSTSMSSTCGLLIPNQPPRSEAAIFLPFGSNFRNLGPNNKISDDDDVLKLALILFLEMTLVGKDDRTSILYWALELVDDLNAFNKFLWGTFIYSRTFNSISTCLVGRNDKFKNKLTDDKLEENVDAPVKRKAKRYHVYGFVTAFQVWAIEAMPTWATQGYATRVNNVTSRILNWQCTGIPTYADIQKTIIKFKNITIYRTLGSTDEEARQPFWTCMDKLKYVLPNVDGCVRKDDVEDNFEDDDEDDVDDAMKDDIDGDHPTRTLKKVEFREKKKRPITFEQVNKRFDDMQTQQNAMQAQLKAIQDQMTSMQNTLNEHNTTDFSHDDNIQDYQLLVTRGVKSFEFLVLFEKSEDVKQFTRPSKLTIRLSRDRKWSAFTVSSYIDPTAKRLRKPKMPKFGSDIKVEDEILCSMQAWISDNKNTW
ncbi:hypothetical protein Ddye_024217 [Dipteronia dyeriana]|uniref:DUF1985 domain-containing protein n=1 Tax=Dipteronia dyeriana TaxID=168575 RepID=A0AAD9TVD0_9ROSI|nr:hypothetical protein Ddye_024217 [Dipteronia dyeriana]